MRRRRRRPLSEEIQRATRTLGITLLFLAVSGAGALLYINSQTATNGYLLDRLSSSNEALLDELRAIQHQSMEAQSTQDLEALIEEPGRTNPDSVLFLEDDSFASRQL